MTADQLELDMAPLVLPERVEGATIQERFEAFHRLNPWVLRALENLTIRYLATGKKRVGVGMLFEVLRYQHDRATTGDPFRLNNSYRSRYVRLMIDLHPEWAEAFETRELKSA